MLSSLPCFNAFADLVSLHLVTFLMFFFILVHVTFFSSRCMLELKFDPSQSLSSQASSVDVCSIGLTVLGSFQNTPCTQTVFLIQQSL